MKTKENKFKDFLCSKAGKVSLIIILYLLIFTIMTALTSAIQSSVPALIVCAVFAVFGWKALNKIRPDIFLIMPVIGWVVFYIVKGLLSFVVGIFVAPFVISKAITEKIQQSLNN